LKEFQWAGDVREGEARDGEQRTLCRPPRE